MKSNNSHIKQNVRSLQCYYRKKGIKIGYLTIRQAAKLKRCSFIELCKSLVLFDTKTKNRSTVIIYNIKFIEWKENE